jgi:hypothetical protein
MFRPTIREWILLTGCAVLGVLCGWSFAAYWTAVDDARMLAFLSANRALLREENNNWLLDLQRKYGAEPQRVMPQIRSHISAADGLERIGIDFEE